MITTKQTRTALNYCIAAYMHGTATSNMHSIGDLDVHMQMCTQMCAWYDYTVQLLCHADVADGID